MSLSSERAKAVQNASDLALVVYLTSRPLPLPIREHRFCKGRRWAFDWAWPAAKVAVEQEGGIWTGGSHVRGKRYLSDCEKYNRAQLLGWIVLRFSPDQIQNGDCMPDIQEALEQRLDMGD